SIPDDVKQRIELLRHAGVDVPTIRTILKRVCTNWLTFIKELYKCLREMNISSLLSQWDSLKTCYPAASTYLSRMEKIKEKWAACYNHNVFMADMTTTQRKESMNNMMKGYLDASTSLVTFITAFQSALNTQNEKTEFCIY
ncbi:7362_t:CDS:2, partial [Funneliformis caledonium]